MISISTARKALENLNHSSVTQQIIAQGVLKVFIDQREASEATAKNSVCEHPKPWKNTPWGYKVCPECNDIVEWEQTAP